MKYLQTAKEWLGQITDFGLSLICTGVVLQVLFGSAVPFVGIDIIGSVLAVTSQLGSEGLVGLVAIWVLAAIYGRE
tara:strand:- start:758 stop:985 length:228 start_codon:yes stop_codon:yes gene_type:complete